MIDARDMTDPVFCDHRKGRLRKCGRFAGYPSLIKAECGEGAKYGEYFNRFMPVFRKFGKRPQKAAHNRKQGGVIRLARDQPEQKARDARRRAARLGALQPHEPILFKHRTRDTPPLSSAHEHKRAFGKSRECGREFRSGPPYSLRTGAHEAELGSKQSYECVRFPQRRSGQHDAARFVLMPHRG